jgi:hypothetical protein
LDYWPLPRPAFDPDVLCVEIHVGFVGGKEHQVFEAIVGFNAVDVMHDFGWFKDAPQVAFHHESVFRHAAISGGVGMVWTEDMPIAPHKPDAASPSWMRFWCGSSDRGLAHLLDGFGGIDARASLIPRVHQTCSAGVPR